MDAIDAVYVLLFLLLVLLLALLLALLLVLLLVLMLMLPRSYPVTGASPFYLSTRITDIAQNNTCKRGAIAGNVCKRPWTQSSRTTYFVADVEEFTVLLAHGAQLPSYPNVQASSKQVRLAAGAGGGAGAGGAAAAAADAPFFCIDERRRAMVRP